MPDAKEGSLYLSLKQDATRKMNVAIVHDNGAPGGSRTHDLWLRRPTLYPAELRAHVTQYIR